MNRSIVLALSLMIAPGCGKSTITPTPGSDAGADAYDAIAPEDVAVDEATIDAPNDAPTDTAVPDAPDAGTSAKPVWVEMPGTVGVCKVQRLSNPSEVHLHQWAQCEGISGCEQAVYHPNVVSKDGHVVPVGDVGYLNGSIVVAHVISDPKAYWGEVFFTDENGQVLDGYRADATIENCASQHGSVGPNGYGVSICNLGDSNKLSECGGVLVSPPKEPVFFTVPKQMGVPSTLPMGGTRWLWAWVLPFGVSTVSSIDGSDYRALASAGKNSLKEIGGAAAAGTHFLVDEYRYADGGYVTERVAITDGLTEPIALVTSPPGESINMSGYAHSHIAWLRAINHNDNGKFDLIELWASPYTTDPAALKPEKISDCPSKYMPPGWQVAGYGYYAVAQIMPNPAIVHEVIWDLNSKQSKEIPYPPATGQHSPVGMTKTHAWVMANVDGPKMKSVMLRFTVK